MTTLSPWSDAARALVGVAFGNPEMREKAAEAERDQKKLEIEERGLALEEALNPYKIDQAGAAAGYDRARTESEGVKLIMDQFKLDSQRKFMEDQMKAMPPQAPPEGPFTYAPIPEFNPANVGPQGQGSNPAITTPYDQIQPLDFGMPAVSDEEFANYPVSPLPEGPAIPSTPYNPTNMPGAPVDDFTALLDSLTGGETAAPPQVAPPQAAPATGMLTPDLKAAIAAGYLPMQSIGDYLLAQEAANANTGVTDPNKRLQNAAAGTGTFISPDEVLAQALGSTRTTEQLGDLGEMGRKPNSVQEFEYGQQDPELMDYLNAKEAGANFTVTNPDGTTVTYGKGAGGGKPPTEAQSKYAVAANQLAAPVAQIEKALSKKYTPSAQDYLIYTYGMQTPGTAFATVQSMSPEGQKFFQALRPVVAQAIFVQSGQAATEAEVARKVMELIPVPGEDPAVTEMKRNSISVLKDTVKGLAKPALPGTPLGDAQNTAGPAATGGLTPEKQMRLQELRAKRDAGTLQ